MINQTDFLISSHLSILCEQRELLNLSTASGPPPFNKGGYYRNTKAPLLKGAGVRWTPLHFNAEAPTEPAGETAVTK